MTLSPTLKFASYLKQTGCGLAGIVTVPILVPDAAVLSNSVTTEVATGLLKQTACSTPGPGLTTVFPVPVMLV